MSTVTEVTKPPVLNETYAAKMDALNHLISHQNAAIDLLASDKRAEIVTNVQGVAILAKNGELLEVMDYGDEIHPEWVDGETHYNPAMNLCHESDEELEDSETIHGCFFEWDKTIPYGMPFDPAEAIFESDTELPAGTYYFTIANDSWGNNNGKNIQFTLTDALPAGYQIRKSVGYNGLVTSGTLDIYSSGASLTKEYSVTPSEGTSGTFLGTSDGSGNINHWHRVALGHNRWKTSNMRQFLNATGEKGTWWTKQEKWDVKPSQADTIDGFLHGYTEDVYRYFKPIKMVTVACSIDNNVEDVTYDRVFLSSLEQMYCVPQFPGKEGEYWEYYKRLLGRTSPAPTSQTYARLIKYALNAPTSAQNCFRRSAYRGNASFVWYVNSSGSVSTAYANGANRCAPSVFLSE